MTGRIKQFVTYRSSAAIAASVLSLAMSACASVPTLNTMNWKEEVLLHDGNTVIAKRSQSDYGLRRGPAYTPPIKEQYVTFSVPGSQESVTWRSEYSEDIGHSNSKAVALHILNSVPYVIAVPYLCLSYNEWGRPNPPYVIFRHDGRQWQRISMAELPLEFENINLVVAPEADEKTIKKQSVVSAELVRKLNSTLDQPEYQTILRKPLSREKCPQYSSGPKAPIPINPGQPEQ